jgi:hypothetical protein
MSLAVGDKRHAIEGMFVQALHIVYYCFHDSGITTDLGGCDQRPNARASNSIAKKLLKARSLPSKSIRTQAQRRSRTDHLVLLPPHY